MDYKTLNHIDNWIKYKFNKTIEIDLLDKINNNLKDINNKIIIKNEEEIDTDKYCYGTYLHFCKICVKNFICISHCIEDDEFKRFENTKYWKLCRDELYYEVEEEHQGCFKFICNDCSEKNYHEYCSLCFDCAILSGFEENI